MAWGTPRGLTIDAPASASTTSSPTRAPTVPASTTVNSSSREWLWGLTRVLGRIVEPDEPLGGEDGMDRERRPENLLGVVLDAYWTSLANDPLASLLLTGLLALAGVLVVLLGHIVVDLAGQLLELLG